MSLSQSLLLSAQRLCNSLHNLLDVTFYPNNESIMTATTQEMHSSCPCPHDFQAMRCKLTLSTNIHELLSAATQLCRIIQQHNIRMAIWRLYATKNRHTYTPQLVSWHIKRCSKKFVSFQLFRRFVRSRFPPYIKCYPPPKRLEARESQWNPYTTRLGVGCDFGIYAEEGNWLGLNGFERWPALCPFGRSDPIWWLGRTSNPLVLSGTEVRFLLTCVC